MPYLVGSISTALTIGKIGSNINYLLELSAAMCLIIGLVLSWDNEPLREETKGTSSTILDRWLPLINAGCTILVALQVGGFIQYSLSEPVETLKWRIKPTKQLTYLNWYVSTKDEPVLVDEFMGLLVTQNRPIEFQPFEMTQLANASIWDQSEFVKSIELQQPSTILLHHFLGYPVYTERWTPEMLKAISENYIVTTLAADTLIFDPHNEAIYGPLNPVACPGAPWNLPTRSEMGMWWVNRQLILMGMGPENTIPVYAVADGMLTRSSDWMGIVAIRHQNPMDTEQDLWVYYSGMSDENNRRSYILSDFPPGATEIAVTKGQLIGYQGRYRGRNIWVHTGISIVQAAEDDNLPQENVSGWFINPSVTRGTTPPGGFIDPSQFFNIERSPVMGEAKWLPLRCE
jgi:hypothetical protein